MCLIVKRSKFNKFIERKLKILVIPKPKKTRKDIKVFKILELNGLFLHSPYYDKGRCWAVNWVYKSDMEGVTFFRNGQFFSTIDVSKGFHSYIDLYRAHLESISNENYIVCEAIVPKGSKYYLGTHGDVVSNQLKITRILD